MRIDLHTHSDVSDGTDAPTALVAHAAGAGLDVIALCDHDTFDGLAEAEDAGRRLGVQVVSGLEMSTLEGRTSVHLLAFGCRTDDPPLLAELARIREGRRRRMPEMLAKLAALGYPITAEEIAAQAGDATSWGRPHVADALVAQGYFVNRDEVFATLLADDGPAYVDRYATPLPEALALVTAAGGVPVLAHPWGRTSRRVLPPGRLAELARLGLAGLEAHHTDHDAATEAELTHLAAALGLLVTGGSDHHGVGKTHNPLGVRTTAPEQYEQLRLRLASARPATGA